MKAATWALHEPAGARLQAEEVHLWLVPLSVPVSQGLSGIERRRLERLRYPRDRQSFAASRWWLRRIVGGYLGLEPRKVEIEQRCPRCSSLEHGPIRAGAIEVSLSRSSPLGLVGLAAGSLGVDIERVDQESSIEEISALFHVHERERLASLPVEERREAAYWLWTAKEAYLKARHEGLSGRLDSCEFAVPPQPAALLNDASWSLTRLRPANGFWATVCTREPATVKLFRPPSDEDEERRKSPA